MTNIINTEYEKLLNIFIDQMKNDEYTYHALSSYKRGVIMFFEYLKEKKISSIAEVTKKIVIEYRSYLYYYKQTNGRPLAISTQSDRIIALRLFFKIMIKKGYVLYDFGRSIQMPKRRKKVPDAILSTKEIKKLINLPDIKTPLGYRDRTILEVLYATGIRNSEIREIKLEDVDITLGEIIIRKGKGGVDRVVPLDKNTAFIIKEYIEKVRPELFENNSHQPPVASHQHYLFLSRYGNKINRNVIWKIVKRYAKKSGIEKKISCHVFRHSIATHLLENGMDIRYIQELLGHKSLQSTQIYTRVAITDLRRMYRKYHPRERRRS